ncbi:hypothetical protein SPRG_11469 [Saprolegnia parasitica CBS 223.65]|uniref:LNR domain-containing protein n=1 Tax=Saprolegnia parasitica (strain CBS 223.65) TaxID=695850 RepID=A0A067C981_SAPPC|nr:hypothetical protein SPRG_11469 [Saprolegnia parasitica CBS 223.65]KDO23377.1 hypothetical protein SPRG_11469 [Saprolegnia parasitica CBS 223.65]|eukprot:XP_012205867.1 hypothetical protein SPRG_11469 [Saprolegnia parasitica CBS 223.65]
MGNRTQARPPRLPASARRIIPAIVFVQHLISALYFTVLSLLYYNASDVDVMVLQGSYMHLSAGVFLCIGALHVYALVRNACRRRRRYQLLTRFTPPWTTLLSPNSYILLSHFVEVGCESYFAYLLADSIVQQHVSFLYAIVLSANCLVTPWVVFVSDVRLKTLLLDAIDCFAGFLLGTCFPLVYFLLPLLHYSFFGNGFEDNDFAWHVRFIPPARLLVTSSVAHLFLLATPSVVTWCTLRRVTRVVNTTWRKRPRMSVAPTRLYVSPVLLQSLSTINAVSERPRTLRTLVLVYSLWGLVVAGMSVHATFLRPPSCPSGCAYAAAPWFDASCHCLYFKLNCVAHEIANSTQIDTYLEGLGARVLYLHIQQCDMPMGLTEATLRQFPSLYALRLEMTQLRAWNVPSAALPSTLMRFEVRYSALATVPQILYDPAASLKWVYLIGSQLHDVPDDVRWRNLISIWLSEGTFTRVPPHILRLNQIEVLAMDRNQIDSLPDTMATSLPSLLWLYMESNALTSFPASLVTPRRHLYFGGNPIAEIPSNSSSARLHMAGSTYCSAQGAHGVGCHTLCAPGCSAMLLQNYLCDRPCNVSACAYDAGDCLWQ